MYEPGQFYLFHCIYSERYEANRFLRRSSPFAYQQQLAVTHRKCATYSDGKPSQFEGRVHTHYIVSVQPNSKATDRTAQHYRERICGSIIRQAAQCRSSICISCKRSACNRGNITQCQECGFRIRVKPINSIDHLLNCISYLQRADPELGIVEGISQTAGESMDYRAQFRILLESLTICNGAQYEHHLAKSENLRILESRLPSHQVETTKKLIFRQIFLSRELRLPLLKRTLKISQTPLANLYEAGFMHFLKRLAKSNGLSVDCLTLHLKRWLVNSNTKRHGLVLMGEPDSGKSFLADLILSCFKPFEIGYFNCPMSTNISPFLFQGLINKMVYRCDELVLEQLGMVQAFKQLTEGSKTLQTDVKFKDALPDGRPVLVTMNGDSPRALVKF